MNTLKFVEDLKAAGFNTVVGVPCSYMKNLINAFINDPDLKWIPAASEGVACSIAAGMTMSGNTPLVIVQSSGVTNLGSCLTSLCNPYEVYFPIMTSHRGDSEVQHEVLDTNLNNLIESYGYDWEPLEGSFREDGTPMELIKAACSEKLFLIVDDKTFDKVALNDEHKLKYDDEIVSRMKFMEELNKEFGASDIKFIGTTGNTAREMKTAMPDTNNFYQAGNMGNALSVGLGAALVGNEVVVLGGDAEFVMHMGGLTTAGRYENIKLVYVLFDNGCNKSTGGQRSYQDHVIYHKLVNACGWSQSDDLWDEETQEQYINPEELSCKIKDYMDNVLNTKPLFLHVVCDVDPETPRPTRDEIINSTEIFKI